MENSTISQRRHIACILSEGYTLTPLMALRTAGSMKLSTRVGEIQRRYLVVVKRVLIKDDATGKRYCKYWCDKRNQKKLKKCLTKSKIGVR